MPGVPVMLNVTGRRCLVVGGGRVAARRARALSEAGGAVTVIAPEVCDELLQLPVEVRRRPVEPDDVRGCFLVVVASSDAAVNDMVAARAREASALVNRADDAASGDVDFMATHRAAPLTVAVHTEGVSAAAAAAIRTELAGKLDPVWPRLLELAAPYRTRIRARFDAAEERTHRLRRLTDAEAVAILKGSGEAAFRQYCEALAAP